MRPSTRWTASGFQVLPDCFHLRRQRASIAQGRALPKPSVRGRAVCPVPPLVRGARQHRWFDAGPATSRHRGPVGRTRVSSPHCQSALRRGVVQKVRLAWMVAPQSETPPIANSLPEKASPTPHRFCNCQSAVDWRACRAMPQWPAAIVTPSKARHVQPVLRSPDPEFAL
jgi:hypothetical protein